MDRFEALRDELRDQPCEHTEAWLDRPLREAGPPPINAAFRAVLGKVGHLLLRDVIMQPDPPALRALNAVDARRLAGWVHDAFSTYEDEVHSVHDHPHGDGDDFDDDEDDLGDADIDVPRQREALRAWAVERGIERHLQTPAQQILDDRNERAQLRVLFPFATPTLEDVLTLEAPPDPVARSAARALLNAAQFYLGSIALLAENDRTQAEAAAALLATPPHPALAALDEQLAAMAEKPSPGSDRLPGTYEPGQTRFALDPPRLVYAEKDRYRRDVWVDLVVMFLARGRASEPCDPHGRALMLSPYRSAALAGARRLLRDADAGSRPALIHWLEMPAWGHALRALDAVSEARPATVFGFRIKARPNGHASVDLVALEQTDAGRPRFADARRVSLARLTDPRDLLAASLLEHERHRQGEITLERVLRALVGHPRVFFEKPQNPVRVVVAEPTLEVRPVERGEGVTLTLSAHGHSLVAPILRDMLAQGPLSVRFEPARGLVELVEWTPPLRAVAKILAGGEAVFPPEAYAALLHQLEKLGPTVPVALPDALLGEPTPPDLRPLVRVDAEAFPSLTVELRARPIAGGGAFVPGEGRARVHASTGGTLVHTVRALDEERARAEALATALALPAPSPEAPFTYALSELDAVGAFARALEAQGEAIAVEWSRPVPIRTLERGALRVEVRARRDWFAIGGEATVDGGELALATLVEAARQGQRFTALPTGGLVELEASLRHELAALGDHARPTREGDLEVATTAAPTLLGLLPDARALDAAPAMARTLARLRDAQDHEPAVPPPMATVLRPYQRDGFTWLSRLAAWSAGAVLADDMGLGKTIQTLALLLSRAALGPALVVAPTSVVRNWLDELAKFGAGLTPVLLRGPGRAARIAQGFSMGEVVVTSYDLAARDVEALAKVRFATLVVDEAQAVKNANTTRAKALRALQADFVVALTGTPIENHLGELWSILRIACPGLLGSWEGFRERFALPIEARADAVARASLSRLLRPFVLRRTKEAVAPELPPLTELVRVVELGAKERAGYEAARQAAVAALEQRGDAPTDRFAALAALMRLRRLACHPRLVDPTRGVGAESSKLAAFLELADEIVESGHRALVFSQFTDHLAVVREALTEKGHRFQYLDGSTPAAARGDEVAAFQGGTAPFFLISLRAGGTGLNLTAADYVVHLDPWWNPAVEDQATDRAHRIGQDRAVTVVRLVARATIEEAVLTLHEAKRALAADILEGTDAAAKLSTRELVELVRAAPAPTDDEPVEVAAVDAAGASLALTKAGLEGARQRLLLRLATRGIERDSPTARTYARTFDRFAQFLGRTAGEGATVDLEASTARYLEALAAGSIDAPKSERGLARTTLGHLLDAVRDDPS